MDKNDVVSPRGSYLFKQVLPGLVQTSSSRKAEAMRLPFQKRGKAPPTDDTSLSPCGRTVPTKICIILSALSSRRLWFDGAQQMGIIWKDLRRNKRILFQCQSSQSLPALIISFCMGKMEDLDLVSPKAERGGHEMMGGGQG